MKLVPAFVLATFTFIVAASPVEAFADSTRDPVVTASPFTTTIAGWWSWLWAASPTLPLPPP